MKYPQQNYKLTRLTNIYNIAFTQLAIKSQITNLSSAPPTKTTIRNIARQQENSNLNNRQKNCPSQNPAIALPTTSTRNEEKK